MSEETKAFLGGSPVSSASNPFSDGEEFGNMPSLQADVDAAYASASGILDAYGSSPVVSDAAAQRPNAPSTDGSSNF